MTKIIHDIGNLRVLHPQARALVAQIIELMHQTAGDIEVQVTVRDAAWFNITANGHTMDFKVQDFQNNTGNTKLQILLTRLVTPVSV